MNEKHIGVKNKLEEGGTFKISQFKRQIKKTRPHKHEEYYELIFLSEGEGFHTIEADQFQISTPELYCLKPGQLHYWQFTSVPAGYVIIFKDAEFNPLTENNIIGLYKKLLNISRIHFNKNTYPELVLSVMYEEYQQNTEYSTEIIHGLFNALIGKILQQAELTQTYNQPESVYDKFQALLLSECPGLHKVSEFANLLHTTPQNLNSICRKNSGRSASDLITSQILLEAKRYILHTDNNINEIAELLQFSDSSNFVKFFRKHENMTPTKFREQYFQ